MSSTTTIYYMTLTLVLTHLTTVAGAHSSARRAEAGQASTIVSIALLLLLCTLGMPPWTLPLVTVLSLTLVNTDNREAADTIRIHLNNLIRARNAYTPRGRSPHNTSNGSRLTPGIGSGHPLLLSVGQSQQDIGKGNGPSRHSILRDTQVVTQTSVAKHGPTTAPNTTALLLLSGTQHWRDKHSTEPNTSVVVAPNSKRTPESSESCKPTTTALVVRPCTDLVLYIPEERNLPNTKNEVVGAHIPMEPIKPTKRSNLYTYSARIAGLPKPKDMWVALASWARKHLAQKREPGKGKPIPSHIGFGIDYSDVVVEAPRTQTVRTPKTNTNECKHQIQCEQAGAPLNPGDPNVLRDFTPPMPVKPNSTALVAIQGPSVDDEPMLYNSHDKDMPWYTSTVTAISTVVSQGWRRIGTDKLAGTIATATTAWVLSRTQQDIDQGALSSIILLVNRLIHPLSTTLTGDLSILLVALALSQV